MNEFDMIKTLDNLAEFACEECDQYDDWLFFYSQARAEGLSDIQAAEMAYKNCEAEG